MGDPYVQHDDGVLLSVRLSAGAASNRIDALQMENYSDCRLKVKVTAVPEKGKANMALCKLLAGAMHVGRNQVKVTSGHTARNKNILIYGDSAELLDTLNTLIADL